jgi:hypothetical protein
MAAAKLMLQGWSYAAAMVVKLGAIDQDTKE